MNIQRFREEREGGERKCTNSTEREGEKEKDCVIKRGKQRLQEK